jgi:CheY-like chemotaxis protein
MRYDSDNRILIVDDNQAIHEDFHKILTGSVSTNLDAPKRLLFGAKETAKPSSSYDVDSAHQGEEGVELVQLAFNEDRCYALAFVDVRMPPGIDGVETAERIWQVDGDIQIVICTAYSDYTWSETVKRLGETNRLLILKKPFDVIEVRQMASALVSKWRQARQIEWQMNELRRARAQISVDYVETLIEDTLG